MMRSVFGSLPIFALGFVLTSARMAPAQQVLPLWPHELPEPAQTTEPEKDTTTDKDGFISGHRTARITNVTHPTMTVYPPPTGMTNTGSAALVFPGGGYVRLAWDGEGNDTCKWLNSLGMTCLLVKYRVPEKGRYPENYADLEDAQQAMRIARAHANEWHINPHHIGVIGFSAGGNLAVLLSTHPDEAHILTTPAAPDVNSRIDARPDFAILGYPAYLIPGNTGDPKAELPTFPTLDPTYTPNDFTPPTFIVAAENDRTYGRNSPTYYEALLAKAIPSQLVMFPNGGHGFGMHPVGRAPEHWTRLAADFLREIEILPKEETYVIPASRPTSTTSNQAVPNLSTPPCMVANAQMTQPGTKPADKNAGKNLNDDPSCW